MGLPDPEWRLVQPTAPCGTAVLLVAGSSGRVDVARAELLARHGATVLAIRWFGGPGQQPGPYGVPLEMFVHALDRIEPGCDRLAVVGTSFGAEAALLVASIDDRVAATVGFAPSAYVWPGWDGQGWTSHWTSDGVPVPWVPLNEGWEAEADPPAYRDWYVESAAAAAPTTLAAATIPVEQIGGRLLLVAGDDDQVWPAADFVRAIADRRLAHDLSTTVVTEPAAGHRTILPGEPVVAGGQRMRRGGTEEADRALGERVWPALVEVLSLRPGAG